MEEGPHVGWPSVSRSAHARTAESELGDSTRLDQRTVERLHAGVRMIALRSLGNVEDADEVAQETLARAFHAVEEGRLETPEKLGAFVTGIARHVIADTHRRRNRTLPPGSELPVAGHPADQLVALIAAEQAHRIRFALSTLSPTDREVLRLSFYEGLEPAEIAERLAEPAPRVRKRKARALDRLRLAFLRVSREEGKNDS